jgi:hypothetical protein
MIHISITSDARKEGKTSLAIRLLQANEHYWLMVRTSEHRRNIIRYYHLPLSIATRIVCADNETALQGVTAEAVIEDLS